MPALFNRTFLSYFLINVSIALLLILSYQIVQKKYGGADNFLGISYAGIVFLVFLATLGMAYFYSRAISRPIRALNQSAKRVAQGDLDAKVYLRTRSELRSLITNFNYMVAQQRQLVERLTENKVQLQKLFISIKEAICVINDRDEISLYNESFLRLSGKGKVHGRKYYEIIREPRFIRFMHDAQAAHSLQGEMTIMERYYSVSLAKVNGCQRYLLTFFDLTEFKSLERMKQDFMLNLSHELRTPLTSIKGFVETMEHERDYNDTYVRIIKRNTERMINIVGDFLALAKLQHEPTLELGLTNISKLLRTISRTFQTKLREKQLAFTMDVGKELEAVYVDAFKLEQVVINLLENAIRYTETGGILLRAWRDQGELVIRVQDTGIGIPKALQARIFERFFVVDKSRSKQKGGTGLGLAIVKQIVDMYKGSIKLTSERGKGSSFCVRFPLHGRARDTVVSAKDETYFSSSL